MTYLDREAQALTIGRDVAERLRRLAEHDNLADMRDRLIELAGDIEATVNWAENGDATLGAVLYVVDNAIAELPAIK